MFFKTPKKGANVNKLSNSIVIGGPIAVGKSNLVGSLPFVPVQDFDSNDKLQNLLLNQMYKGDATASQIFQLDILFIRFNKYKKLANSEKTHVFIRSIFEDLFLAKLLLTENNNIWEYYYSIWESKLKELKEEIGLPKMYLILTCSWETFKEKVFSRKSMLEFENFSDNEDYFKKMIDGYEDFMVELLKEHNISYKVINTDVMNNLEIIDEAKKALKEEGVI